MLARRVPHQTGYSPVPLYGESSIIEAYGWIIQPTAFETGLFCSSVDRSRCSIENSAWGTGYGPSPLPFFFQPNLFEGNCLSLDVVLLVTVREFMSAPPLTLDSETSVANACKFMGEKHIGSVLLSRKGVVVAIFTERDLISKVLREGKDLSSIAVGSYSSSPLVTVAPTTDVKEAARAMAELRVRRLVVIEDGKPIGMFTAADLTKAVGTFPLDL